MRLDRYRIALAVVLCLAAGTRASAQAPAAAPATLWSFLGIPQGINKISGATTNTHGNFPGLERQPPLKSLADPANLQSQNPAIKTAAQIKAEEDLARQKIKALKYLAKVGCGCYPGVKEALMAALEDCTERVRFQAAQSIAEAAVSHCKTCNKSCCCDEEMSMKLAEVVYERDDKGCYLESSVRVRQAALQALRACCRGGPGLPYGEAVETPPPTPVGPGTVPEPVPVQPLETTPQGNPVPRPNSGVHHPQSSPRLSQHSNPRPVSQPVPGNAEMDAAQHVFMDPKQPNLQRHAAATSSRVPPKAVGNQSHASTGDLAQAGAQPALLQPSGIEAARPVTIRVAPGRGSAGPDQNVAFITDARADENRKRLATPAATPRTAPAAVQPAAVQPAVAQLEIKGAVADLDLDHGTARLIFPGMSSPTSGVRVRVYHQSLFGPVCMGSMRVISVGQGVLIARPMGELALNKVSPGDQVFFNVDAASQATESHPAMALAE